MTKLTATDILEMLSRARKLGYDTYIYPTEKGYEIQIDLSFPGYGKITETISVNIENEDSRDGSYDFNTMMNLLEDELKVLKQKEEKAQKRKELIDSLTPEQRELLGV